MIDLTAGHNDREELGGRVAVLRLCVAGNETI